MLLPNALVCRYAPEYLAHLMLRIRSADSAPRAPGGECRSGAERMQTRGQLSVSAADE